jgi:uncharacterized protein
MRPAPVLTEDNEGFWRAAADGRLVVQQCASCNAYHHPPRPMCPACHSLELRWADMVGTGSVYSYALLDHPRHPAFSYPVPAVVIELDEGVRLVSNLVDIDPHDISIGLRVEVAFEPTAEDLAVPVFRPETDQA